VMAELREGPVKGKLVEISTRFYSRWKEFSLKFVNGGEVIRMVEKSYRGWYDLDMDLGMANWLLRELGRVDWTDGKQGRRQQYRSGVQQLMVESMNNDWGRVLRFMKVVNGQWWIILIPFDEGSKILDHLKQSLRFMLYKDKTHSYETKAPFEKLESHTTRWQKGETSQQATQKLDMCAVVIFRRSIHDSWGEIQSIMEETLGREVALLELCADRALIHCVNEDECKRIIMEESKTSVGMIRSIQKWKQEFHWEDQKIHSPQGWIKIIGLPLNMWNYHTFKIIGSMCGGLIEVDEETKAATQLRYARLRVHGGTGGFLPAKLKILCWGVERIFDVLPEEEKSLVQVSNSESSTPILATLVGEET
jgi:hypothetical protein